MKFKKLGNTDLKVSLICLGTMTWGEQNNQEEAFEQMDYALDQGVNFFDTAEMYAIPPSEKNFGTTETIIGNWFIKRNNREKVILATKISGPGLSWIRGGGLQYTKENITTALEGSLKRLLRYTLYLSLFGGVALCTSLLFLLMKFAFLSSLISLIIFFKRFREFSAPFKLSKVKFNWLL